MHLYDDLVDWYHLLDPLEDHADEAAAYLADLRGAADGRCESLLELGCGAGNNAHYLAKSLRCTLVDLSPKMLALSAAQNPGCVHVPGDMRTVRLNRNYDAVLAHDAICYMTTEADVLAVAETAFAHTRPGGAALFVPDYTRETFGEVSALHHGDDAQRAMRCLEWTYDPDPTDTNYVVDHAFLLRDASGVRAVHDRHIEGLFDQATWLRLIREAGFVAELLERPVTGGHLAQVFVGRRRPARREG